MTYYEINMNTQNARERKPQASTVAQQLAHYARALAEMDAAGMSWTRGYKQLKADYEALKGGE